MRLAAAKLQLHLLLAPRGSRRSHTPHAVAHLSLSRGPLATRVELTWLNQSLRGGVLHYGMSRVDGATRTSKALSGGELRVRAVIKAGETIIHHINLLLQVLEV